MNAPDKIWAVFEKHHSKKGHPHVMATCEETNGTPYYRDPMTDPRVVALVEALKDAMAGLEYVRYHYGELHGVGFMRVRDAGDAALAAMKGETG